MVVWLGLVALVWVCGCGTEAAQFGSDDDSFAADDDDDDSAEPPPPIEETFEQQPEPVDILFVVDNSCSMMEEQQALRDNFESLFAHMDGVDFHIGVTVLDDWATQPPIGQLFGPTPYIDPATPDPVDTFWANMTMGYDGMGACEVGLEASYRAVTEPLVSGHNAGFYRDEARLTIVVVSDEVDGSVTGCEGITAMEYAGWLHEFKDRGLDGLLFAAVVGDDSGGCESSWGSAEPGRGYLDVVDELGPDHASFNSICDHYWAPLMSTIGQTSVGPNTHFPLAQWPDPATLEVFLDMDGDGPGVELPIPMDPAFEQENAWEYDDVDNAVRFDTTTAPPVGAQLRVTYQPAA